MAQALVRADGNWVEGDRFWNRDAEIETLIERIDEGAHSLIVAQRRIGKTSLMREVARRLGDRYACLFVDLQDCHSPEDAIAALSAATRPHSSLWSKTKELFANTLKPMADHVDSLDFKILKLNLRTGINSGDWQGKGDGLLAALARTEAPVVVFFDEIAILVNRLLRENGEAITGDGRRVADLFMSWLRANSIEHKGRLRFVLAGSIGLEPVLHQAGLSATINTFVPFPLEPWDAEVAPGCLLALANQYGIRFQEGVLDHIIGKLGCLIPHHVQMFFSHLYEYCKRRRRTEFSVQDVEVVYQRRMLGSRGQAELSHYEERLELVLGKDLYPLASDLLTEAAVTGYLSPRAMKILVKDYQFPGRTADDVLRLILGILQHDGYLEESQEGFVFISNLLKDWWRGRNRAFFVPAAEREA